MIKFGRPNDLRRSLLAAAAAGVLALGASPAPEPADPTSSPSVQLRMEEIGGFAPFHALLLRVPAFTLYADGRAIYQDPDAGTSNGPIPPLREARLDRDQAAEVLAQALDAGGLRDARAEYSVEGIADATTTVFTVDGDGIRKTVSIYGLGFGEEGPDREALVRFFELARLLSDAEAFLPDDVAGVAYEPALYRGIFTEDDPAGHDLLAWPWEDLAPDDLVPHADATAVSQADLTPEQVARVTDVPNGGAFDIAIAAPDGSSAWRLALRPLLPDETPLATVDVVPAPTAGPAGDDGYDHEY